MRKTIFLVGIVAFMLVALFPPMIGVTHGREWPAGHRFLFSTPYDASSVGGMPISADYYIDYRQLAVLLGVVAIVTTGAAVAYRR